MTLRPSCPVLVVEDDETFRKALTAALDESHFTVTIAADGESAINALRERPFHVVILDLNLPGTSGFEVLRYVRENREKLEAKVIVVSAVDPTLREKTDLSAAEEVLLKPVDFRYIVQRASRYCGH